MKINHSRIIINVEDKEQSDETIESFEKIANIRKNIMNAIDNYLQTPKRRPRCDGKRPEILHELQC